MSNGTLDTKPKRPHTADPITKHEPVAGKSTGVGIVDAGTKCETASTPSGCFLTESQRTRLLGALGHVALIDATNFHAALQNVQLELATVIKTTNGWNLFTEILFQSISGGLLGMLGKSLSKFKAGMVGQVFDQQPVLVAGVELPASVVTKLSGVSVKKITNVALTASKGLRTLLKNAAHKTIQGANPDDRLFLSMVQEGIGPMATQLALEAPTQLNDDEIAALVEALQDPDYHSIAAYEAMLRDLLARFNAQSIPQIGDGMNNGESYMSRKQAVHVVAANGKKRVAILEYFDEKFAGPVPEKLYEDKLVPWSKTQFVSWIDSDLETAAIAFSMDRVGDLKYVSAPGTGIHQIDDWALQEGGSR
jgi:hypothetical protein